LKESEAVPTLFCSVVDLIFHLYHSSLMKAAALASAAPVSTRSSAGPALAIRFAAAGSALEPVPEFHALAAARTSAIRSSVAAVEVAAAD
jgi:hypothetical protein